MQAHNEIPEGASSRLNELLLETNRFKPLKHGLTEELKAIAEVSYTTARKWLFSNTLPRTPEERIRVSEVLGVDLLYWEYGYRKEPEILKPFETDYLFHIKVANQVMEIIHNEKLDIEPDKIIEIELIAFEIAKAKNCSEPEIDTLKSLIKLAT
tara:strand:- start:1372 stop:1833 length:462 start_codon:yes stop_codon:yes gene_type:complete